MSWVGVLAIAIFFLYLIPWFVIHCWLLVTRGKSLGGDSHPESIALIYIFGTIPFINLYLVFQFFIMPLWYKFKYRNGVPMPKVPTDD